MPFRKSGIGGLLAAADDGFPCSPFVTAFIKLPTPPAVGCTGALLGIELLFATGAVSGCASPNGLSLVAGAGFVSGVAGAGFGSGLAGSASNGFLSSGAALSIDLLAGASAAGAASCAAGLANGFSSAAGAP